MKILFTFATAIICSSMAWGSPQHMIQGSTEIRQSVETAIGESLRHDDIATRNVQVYAQMANRRTAVIGAMWMQARRYRNDTAKVEKYRIDSIEELAKIEESLSEISSSLAGADNHLPKELIKKQILVMTAAVSDFGKN